MALKPDRRVVLDDVSFYKTDATAERGIIVAHDTGGSGAAMDDANAKVRNVSATSDKPAGLLMNDVVNYDPTRQPYNPYKDEVLLGGKVTLLRKGVVVTDQISGNVTVGNAAHFNAVGQLVDETVLNTSAKVGVWLSTKDPDGFAKVEIDIV